MHENERATVSYHIEIHQAQGLVIGDRAQVTQWYGDAEAQRRRVEAGVAAERAVQEEARLTRVAGRGTRVVGVKPDAGKHFLDRDREREQIRLLLADPATQLITLAGQGGMGKTALACKALDDLVQQRRDEYRDGKPVDGILYMSTRTAGISLERVFQDCARMLGGDAERRLLAAWTNPELSVQAEVAQLLEALSDGRFVVLLDNLDDLLDAEGRLTDEGLQFFLEQSLRSGQGAALLATTRRELRLAFDVQALNEQLRLDEGLPVAEGVALLRKLDRRGRLRGLADSELAQAVTAVHGVPRALQLIPSLLAGQPAGTGLAETMQRFYGSPEVVKALIEENYRRLTVGARQVMDALAVLRRPVPIVAMDYLLEPFAPGLDAPALLAELVAWSIVSEDYRSGLISLHPVDQDYAYSRLPDEAMRATSYTRQTLERRAAAYYRELRTPEETWKTIDDLAPQLAEYEHLVRADAYLEAYELLEIVDKRYLFHWGHIDRVLEMRAALVGFLKEANQRITNLDRLALCHQKLSLNERSIELYREALEEAQRTGDLVRQAQLLGDLGNAYRHKGESVDAIQLAEEAIKLARATGNEEAELSAVSTLANAHHDLGRLAEARDLDKQAILIAEKLGDRTSLSDRLGHLGWVHLFIGDLSTCIEYQQRAIAEANALGERTRVPAYITTLGMARFAQGCVADSLRYYGEALNLAQTIGDQRVVGSCLGNTGIALQAVGRLSEALQQHRQALEIARRSGHLRGLAADIGNIGRVCQDAGDFTMARQNYNEALAITQKVGDRLNSSQWLQCLATLDIWERNDQDAATKIAQALEISRQLGDRQGESRLLTLKSRLALAMGDANAAEECCRTVLAWGFPMISFDAALVVALANQQRKDIYAELAFREAISHCRIILDRTSTLVRPRYTLAIAQTGLAVCDSVWKVGRREDLLAGSLVAFRQALEICSAPGIVQEVIRDLTMMESAGIEGLEPLFKLLSEYVTGKQDEGIALDVDQAIKTIPDQAGDVYHALAEREPAHGTLDHPSRF
jgi:tetratricopeptide (TPR) repeat protein